MAEFIHEHSTRLTDEDGTAYVVRIYARERPDGTWEGWLEFHPTDERKSVLRTEQETSQPNRLAVGPSHVRKDGCCRLHFSQDGFSSLTETSKEKSRTDLCGLLRQQKILNLAVHAFCAGTPHIRPVSLAKQFCSNS